MWKRSLDAIWGYLRPLAGSVDTYLQYELLFAYKEGVQEHYFMYGQVLVGELHRQIVHFIGFLGIS